MRYKGFGKFGDGYRRFVMSVLGEVSFGVEFRFESV